MSKGKRNRAKRSGQARPEDYKAYVGMGGFQNTEEVIGALRGMDETSYNIGRGDSKSGRKLMSLEDFAEDGGYDEDMPDVPPAIKMTIIRANYAAYLDGYHGRAFQEHTIVEEV